jgi:hypothetical protein
MFKDNKLKRKIWIYLSTRSRRALRRKQRKWGHFYFYKPRRDLCQNLSEHLGIDFLTIYTTLIEMHEELIQ